MTLEIHGISAIDALRIYVGDELFARLRSRRHLYTALPGGALLLMFHVQRAGAGRQWPVCVYLDREKMLLFTDDAKCVEGMRAQQPYAPPEALRRFLDALTGDDVDMLEQLETDVTELEDTLLTAKRMGHGVGNRIITFRRTLLHLKRYYEQLALMTEFLAGDAGDALDEEQRRRFETLNRHIDRLLDYVLHLREYVTQVREAYQAQLDFEQNQLMKVFTVLTAIFLPLSLIVGWYGMNFAMPEYKWPFGYAFVALLSIAVCGVCFFIFKRKKWL